MRKVEFWTQKTHLKMRKLEVTGWAGPRKYQHRRDPGHLGPTTPWPGSLRLFPLLRALYLPLAKQSLFGSHCTRCRDDKPEWPKCCPPEPRSLHRAQRVFDFTHAQCFDGRKAMGTGKGFKCQSSGSPYILFTTPSYLEPHPLPAPTRETNPSQYPRAGRAPRSFP